MKPIVVVAGIMDTKGKELLYIRDRVRVMGCDTLMIELSLGKEVKADWIDVHISDLLRGVDKTPSDIFAMTRGDAAKVVTEAAIKYITRLQKSGKMHALIAYCGGMGSSIVAPVMQTLPYGMPKILLSTMVHCAEQYLANKDIAMLYSVTEAGLNHISRQILNTAAGVVTGGAKAYVDFKDEDAKPLIAVTMQGVTTPCAERVVSHIAQSNEYDGILIILIVSILKVGLSSNTVTASIIVPIIIALATTYNLPMMGIVIPACLTLALAFILVTSTPTSIIPYSYGYFTITDMAKPGTVLTLLSSGILTLVIYSIGLLSGIY